MMPCESIPDDEDEFDLMDEYEPDPYYDGYELDCYERAIADMET